MLLDAALLLLDVTLLDMIITNMHNCWIGCEMTRTILPCYIAQRTANRGICTNQSILASLFPNTYATLKLCFAETCINSHELIALSTTTQAQPIHPP
jgi:hypothetical protein